MASNDEHVRRIGKLIAKHGWQFSDEEQASLDAAILALSAQQPEAVAVKRTGRCENHRRIGWHDDCVFVGSAAQHERPMTNPTTAEKVRERDAYEAIDALVEFAGIELRTVFADDHKRVILNYISTLTADLASLQREREWQPIDSAPTDVVVWLFDPESTPQQYAASLVLRDPSVGGYYWRHEEKLVCDVLDYEVTPTHWIPLPVAPTDTARGAGNGRGDGN